MVVFALIFFPLMSISQISCELCEQMIMSLIGFPLIVPWSLPSTAGAYFTNSVWKYFNDFFISKILIMSLSTICEMDNRIVYQSFHARLQDHQCISNGDISVLHKSISIILSVIIGNACSLDHWSGPGAFNHTHAILFFHFRFYGCWPHHRRPIYLPQTDHCCGVYLWASRNYTENLNTSFELLIQCINNSDFRLQNLFNFKIHLPSSHL